MDLAILQFIQEHFRSSIADTFFVTVTFLGNSGLIWLLLSVCFLCAKKYRRLGFVLLAALAVTFLLGDVALKNCIQRPRPFQEAVSYTHLDVYKRQLQWSHFLPGSRHKE